MKRLALCTFAILTACVWLRCSSDSDSSGNSLSNNTTNPIHTAPNQGAEELSAVCGSCSVDSGTYSKNGNAVTLYADSTDTQGLTLIFTTVNDSQAIATLDTTLIPPALGSVELVFERESGTGSSIENDLWRLDSIRIASESLGVTQSIAAPGDAYLVLDSRTHTVLSTFDTTGMQQQLLIAAVAGCPMLLFQAAAPYPITDFMLPLDSLDASRSTCDTSWGYESGVETYVVSNGTDSLYAYHAATKQQTGGTDIKALVAGLMLFINLSSLQ